MLVGIVGRSAGEPLAGVLRWAGPVAVASAWLEVAAVALFVAIILATWRAAGKGTTFFAYRWFLFSDTRPARRQATGGLEMKATDVLMVEHRFIEQVLNCLEKLAERCEAGEAVGTFALEAIDFFRNFADRCHHGKEEGHLFPLLEARGFKRESGPTGVMLHEHEEGRKLVDAMAEAIERDASHDFVRHARAYVRLLREHIRKEENCLFPMAAGILSGTDAEALAERFEHVEHAEMAEGTHEYYLELANKLAERLNVQRAEVTSTCGHAGCRHH